MHVFGSELAGRPTASLPGAGTVETVARWFETSQVFDDAITAAEAGLSVDGSGIVQFDAAAAEAAGLSPIDSVTVDEMVVMLNDYVDKGYLSLAPGASGYQTITSLSPAFFTGVAWRNTLGASSAEITITDKWYGTVTHIPKEAVDLIVKLMGVGTTAAATVTALQAAGVRTIGTAALTAIIAALIALGASVLSAMDRCNGVNWILLKGMWNGSFPLPA